MHRQLRKANSSRGLNSKVAPCSKILANLRDRMSRNSKKRRLRESLTESVIIAENSVTSPSGTSNGSTTASITDLSEYNVSKERVDLLEGISASFLRIREPRESLEDEEFSNGPALRRKSRSAPPSPPFRLKFSTNDASFQATQALLDNEVDVKVARSIQNFVEETSKTGKKIDVSKSRVSINEDELRNDADVAVELEDFASLIIDPVPKESSTSDQERLLQGVEDRKGSDGRIPCEDETDVSENPSDRISCASMDRASKTIDKYDHDDREIIEEKDGKSLLDSMELTDNFEPAKDNITDSRCQLESSLDRTSLNQVAKKSEATRNHCEHCEFLRNHPVETSSKTNVPEASAISRTTAASRLEPAKDNITDSRCQLESSLDRALLNQVAKKSEAFQNYCEHCEFLRNHPVGTSSKTNVPEASAISNPTVANGPPTTDSNALDDVALYENRRDPSNLIIDFRITNDANTVFDERPRKKSDSHASSTKDNAQDLPHHFRARCRTWLRDNVARPSRFTDRVASDVIENETLCLANKRLPERTRKVEKRHGRNCKSRLDDDRFHQASRRGGDYATYRCECCADRTGRNDWSRSGSRARYSKGKEITGGFEGDAFKCAKHSNFCPSIDTGIEANYDSRRRNPSCNDKPMNDLSHCKCNANDCERDCSYYADVASNIPGDFRHRRAGLRKKTRDNNDNYDRDRKEDEVFLREYYAEPDFSYRCYVSQVCRNPSTSCGRGCKTTPTPRRVTFWFPSDEQSVEQIESRSFKKYSPRCPFVYADNQGDALGSQDVVMQQYQYAESNEKSDFCKEIFSKHRDMFKATLSRNSKRTALRSGNKNSNEGLPNPCVTKKVSFPKETRRAVDVLLCSSAQSPDGSTN